MEGPGGYQLFGRTLHMEIATPFAERIVSLRCCTGQLVRLGETIAIVERTWRPMGMRGNMRSIAGKFPSLSTE
jgi:hypothetical protein